MAPCRQHASLQHNFANGSLSSIRLIAKPSRPTTARQKTPHLHHHLLNDPLQKNKEKNNSLGRQHQFRALPTPAKPVTISGVHVHLQGVLHERPQQGESRRHPHQRHNVHLPSLTRRRRFGTEVQQTCARTIDTRRSTSSRNASRVGTTTKMKYI